MAKLERDFYLGDTVEIARQLPGTYLARRLGDETLLCRITETEAYVGRLDKACHTYGRGPTARTAVMFGEGGHAYIYFTYGMHHCLNFVTEPAGTDAAVLIRGLAPLYGEETISRLRFGAETAALTPYQRKNFLNGPGKVCKGLSLSRAENGMDLTGDTLFVVRRPTDVGLPDVEEPPRTLHAGKRIGIDYAEEAKDFLWRFWI